MVVVVVAAVCGAYPPLSISVGGEAETNPHRRCHLPRKQRRHSSARTKDEMNPLDRPASRPLSPAFYTDDRRRRKRVRSKAFIIIRHDYPV
jgi:hypothetical protein